MSDRPIATYTERLLEVQRDFALYPDRVVVTARWVLKGTFETVVRLATLRSEIQELTIRYRLFRYSSWIITAGGLLFAVAYFLARGGPLGMLGHVAVGTMILGMMLMGLTYQNRRIKFARFNSKSGRAGLDIGSAGNKPAAFKQFVEQVKRQIQKA